MRTIKLCSIAQAMKLAKSSSRFPSCPDLADIISTGLFHSG
ncbi:MULTISPECIES: hypothetical protein [unclassified Microcoleus]